MDELRRAFHDRIAELRTQTLDLLDQAATGVENMTVALRTGIPTPPLGLTQDALKAKMATLDAEILELLGQQSPMARDLRMVLASQRIGRLADLCLGLVRTLANGASWDAASDRLRDVALEIETQAAALLRAAAGAWASVSEELAFRVLEIVPACRALHRVFLAELFSLHDLPVETAVELGMAARAFERLVDHGAEIAGQVVFAATGQPAASVAS